MDRQSRRSNATGNMFDDCRAEVVNNQHEKGWHMAQVRLLVGNEGIPEKDLPWAEYLLPLGARPGEGDFMPVQPGDLVWVDFPVSGDTRFPRIIGSCYSVDGKGTGESLLPQDGFKPTYSHKRTGKQPPAPQAQYGDKVLDLFGLLQQLTKNGEWCLTHKSTGTALEIDGEGNVIFHAEGDRFDSATGTHTTEVGKDLNITVKGSTNIKTTGDTNIESEGKVLVKGSKVTLIDGAGVVTGNHKCMVTGKPHGDCSKLVFAAN